MNCKPGMVVMVKRSQAGNEGRVGTIVKWVERHAFTYPSGLVNRLAGWLVDGTFRGGISGKEHWGVFPDEWLIPLPGGEGADESLTWAGKPSDINTKEAA